MAMTPVAFVLFAREVTGSFAAASLVLAGQTIGILAWAPIRGRLVDRLGPTPVLLLLAAPSLAADVALILAGREGAATAALVAIAFVAGATLPPVTSAFRMVFGKMIVAGGDEHAGFALLSMVGEITFLTGPLLAGALIALGSSTLAVAVAAALSAAGAVAFATSRRSRSQPPVESRHAGLSPPGGPGLRTVLGAAVFFGINFGLLDVAYPAFATDHGSPASAGFLLAAIALGIGGGSFAYGLRARDPAETMRLYPALCGLAAAGLAPLAAADSIAVLGLLSVVCGVCFAPLTVSANLAIERFAPLSRAEAFSWLGALYGAGAAVGAPLGGQLVDSIGPRAGIAAGCAAMVLATAFVLLRSSTLRVEVPAVASVQQGATVSDR
jgi:predicted MFS family arabinose efflux permease